MKSCFNKEKQNKTKLPQMPLGVHVGRAGMGVGEDREFSVALFTCPGPVD